jgi:hypothetical protein
MDAWPRTRFVAAAPVIACCSSLAAMNELPPTPTAPTTIHALCALPCAFHPPTRDAPLQACPHQACPESWFVEPSAVCLQQRRVSRTSTSAHVYARRRPTPSWGGPLPKTKIPHQLALTPCRPDALLPDCPTAAAAAALPAACIPLSSPPALPR